MIRYMDAKIHAEGNERNEEANDHAKETVNQA